MVTFYLLFILLFILNIYILFFGGGIGELDGCVTVW